MTIKLIKEYISMRDNLSKKKEKTDNNKVLSELGYYLTDEVGFNESLSNIENALNQLLKANNISKKIDITSDICNIIEKNDEKNILKFIKFKDDEKTLNTAKDNLKTIYPMSPNSIFLFSLKKFIRSNKAGDDLYSIVDNNDNISIVKTKRLIFVVGSKEEIVSAFKKDARFLKTVIGKFDDYFNDVSINNNSNLIKLKDDYIDLDTVSLESLNYKKNKKQMP